MRERRPGTYFHWSQSLGARGETQVLLTVASPAAGLAGRGQRLEVRYALCGLHTDLAPMVSALFGVLLLVPPVLTAIVAAISRGARRRRDAPSAEPSG